MKRNDILGEHKKGVKAKIYNQHPTTYIAPSKPNNPVAKNANAAIGGGGAGAHKDAKKASQAVRGQKHKNAEMAEGWRDRRDAYQRDYDSSVSGMGKHDSLAYRMDGGANDEGWDEEPRQRRHEPAADAPHDVYIDGRKWKTFDSASHARNVARKLQEKGKNATVKAASTDEATGDALGTVSSVTPDGKVSIKTTTGAEVKTDQSALMPGANGTVQMKPDAAGDTLKPGAKVVSTEDIGVPPSTDSSSPINGDEENVDLRRLRELAGQPAAPATEAPPADAGEYDAIDSAESYKAFLKKSAAADGLTPEQTAELEGMMVMDPDGSIDMDATMVKTMKGLADIMPQLYEMFVEWIGLLEKAKADPAQWAALTPEEQKSIDEAIVTGKAQLSDLQAQVKQMQAQVPELDKAIADRKAAGTTMKIPANPAVEEGELAEMLRIAGLK